MVEQLQRYLPKKYIVYEGIGKSTSVCAGWDNLEKTLKHNPELLENAALVGNLYSRGGVSILLRNLALNPQINKLVLWGNGDLSKTEFGKRGLDLLRQLWSEGIHEDGLITGTKYRIEKEIPPEIVRGITDNVKLIEMSDQSLEEVIHLLVENNIEVTPYMEPRSFTEPQRENIETLPSEKIGFIVREKTILKAWLQMTKMIMAYGEVKPTEYGNNAKELKDVTWIITDQELENITLPDWLEISQIALQEYQDEFLNQELPEGTAYTYGQRLGAWPAKEPINQIAKMAEHTTTVPFTRRATATTMHPEIDLQTTSPPCLTQVQTLVTNNRIDMFATMRSQDVGKAGIPNLFGLVGIHQDLADSTNYQRGTLSVHVISAHIYEEDWEHIQRTLKTHLNNEKPSVIFDETRESDPRGNFIVSVREEKIHLEMTDTDGLPLPLEISGSSPKVIMRKLAQLNAVSRMDHMGDIGIQLARAEACLNLGIPFKQDQKPDYKNRQ